MNTPESETPRTDAAIYPFYDESTGKMTSVVDPEEMAKLECELSAAQKEIAELREELENSSSGFYGRLAAKATAKRDSFRTLAQELVDALSLTVPNNTMEAIASKDSALHRASELGITPTKK